MRRLRFLFAAAKYLCATALVAGVFMAAASDGRADGMAQRAAPVMQAPTTWSGLYFGVNSGWAWSESDITFVGPPALSIGGIQHDAPTVGGQIGLQHQFGNVVLGIEADLTVLYQNNPGSVTSPNPAFSSVARLHDILTIGPRLGWAMGKWMPYIAGGYASARFEELGVVRATGVTFDQASERHSGWYIGGGIDMALAAGWTMGIEYRHYEFDRALYHLATPAGVPVPGDNLNNEPTADTISLRVSWKLDRPEPVRPLK
jgi:opacity protein-like surface antigen